MPTAGALRAKFRRRRSPAEDKVSILEREEQREVEAPRSPEDHSEEEVGCASKTVAFAALPDKYQPLARDGEQPPPRKTERASKARKRRLKKYGKNVGRVFQKGCSYLVLGSRVWPEPILHHLACLFGRVHQCDRSYYFLRGTRTTKTTT